MICWRYPRPRIQQQMKYLYSELPALQVAGTRLVGRVVFGLLVLAAALVGAFAGLLIVYSTDLPKVLRDAVISIEDKDFERHWGINLWRILGAFYRDLIPHRNKQGASTLT